ncbi:MAG: ChaN family lipoprotein [Deltaproteobacteria bacterium]|nr:ChaN family lipoprotein [Deltaproteobacteria bacterium]
MASCGVRQPRMMFGGSPYVAPDSLQRDEIIHLPTGVRLSRSELFALLARERIIYVGEGHDNIYDHEVEFEVVKNLWQRFPGRVVVGFEMLARANQEKVDQWLAGKISEDDFIRVFAEDWGLSEFAYYQELFAFLKLQKIPVQALNVSRHEKMVFMQGLKSGGEGSASALQASQMLEDSYQEEALRAMFAGHDQGHGDLGMFLKVHQLWEETMAGNIAAYLESPSGADKVFIVIAGGFHVARGYGLPRRVFQRTKAPYCILLTHTPETLVENQRQTMEVDFPELPLYLGDYLWCVPYRNLKDRQVKLGVGLQKAATGIEVVMVEPGSPAEKYGLKVGDLILKGAGEDLGEPFALSLLIAKKSKGDRLELLIEREGKRQTIEVQL